MQLATFIELFEEVLDKKMTSAPYDNPTYYEYVKLNRSRQNRWFKTMPELPEELRQIISEIRSPQHWIIITEPWCMDSANILPFLAKIARSGEHITLDIQLRDTEPFLIDRYLTNGGKSVPKLVVRDAQGEDLFTWGPRPETAQQLIFDRKNQGVSATEYKTELQQWYNADKGASVWKELGNLLQDVVAAKAH